MRWKESGLWSALLCIATLISLSAASQSTASTKTEASIRPFNTLYPADRDVGQPVLPNIVDPNAADAQQVCPGYQISNVKRQDNALTATLALAGNACNVYGNDVESLQLVVEYQSADRLHIQIEPTYIGSNNRSWFVPPNMIRQDTIDEDADRETSDLEFVYGDDPSFWIKVVRRSNNEVVFDTSGSVLVFEDQFVEFVTRLPEEYNIYGLGETIHALRLGNNLTKTMWNADSLDAVDRNIYGTHPVYYETRYYSEDGTYLPWSKANADSVTTSASHGVYYRNTHGHEILLESEALTWRTLGGNIDLYFYPGPTIEDAAKSYQHTVGFPAMHQYWTLGYHSCSPMYSNWSQVEQSVAEYEKFRIPLETQWMDFDYMNELRNFELAPAFNKEDGKRLMDQLHASGRHYVEIVDSGIYKPNPDNASDLYPPYDRGHEANVFMLNTDGTEYLGAVWPGYTVFPDWFTENASTWWTDEITRHHDDISFDGIWMDMSEASSFCVGSCGTGDLDFNPFVIADSEAGTPGWPEGFANTNASEAVSASASLSSYSATAAPKPTTTSFLPQTTPTSGGRNINYPPYVINNYFYDLAVHDISPNATHRDALQTQEYDVHAIWGFNVLNATYHALLNIFPTKRPFIIARSTFAGAGAVGGHWGGDNWSQWRYMYWSIPQGLSMSLFGIPMFGVDTCGYLGNTDEELCNRWMQLSAFFPFCILADRNYGTGGVIPQEPYRWASVITATKSAMEIRYALLPYIYTLFQSAHTTGNTVMRALSWNFPNEARLAAADRQFMLGSSILITPVLEQGADHVYGVFPGKGEEVWYDWYNQSRITDPAALRGDNVSIPAPLGHIPVFVKGGSMLAMQPLSDALTIQEVRDHAWTVLVGLDCAGGAAGSVYIDDGESISPNATLEVMMTVANKTVSVRSVGQFVEERPLANVTIMGVSDDVSGVTMNGKAAGFRHDPSNEVLAITGLEAVTAEGAWAQAWTLTWM